ncbi:MAG: SET domain-containing protein-lysine N-methyltransferase [Microcoleaceae cyanobacterium]
MSDWQVQPESNFKIDQGDLGFELIAMREILKGELVMAVFYRLADFQTRHTFEIDDKKHVICPVVEYINHSCDPNCGLIFDTYNSTFNVISIRAISIGENLTIDYCTFEESIKYMPTQCLCGAKICRGSINGFSDLSIETIKKYSPFIPTYIKRKYNIRDSDIFPSFTLNPSGIAYEKVAERIVSKKPIFVNDIESLSFNIQTVLMLTKSFQATRVSIRLVLPKSFYQVAIDYLSSKGFKIEAEICLDEKFSDHVIIYIGRNEFNRISAKYILSEQEKLLKLVLSGEQLSPSEIKSRLATRPYKVELLKDKVSVTDRNLILNMHQESLPRYQQYDFSRKLDAMLSDPETYTIAVVRGVEDKSIHAFCNIEHTSISLGNHRVLRLAEFDNCVKSQAKDAPNSLAVHLRLSLALDAFSQGTNLCFSESRAANGGINGANHRLSMKYCGTLAQAIDITGPNDIDIVDMDTQRRYEDLNVWSLTPKVLAIY